MAKIDTTKAAAKAVAEKLAGRKQNSTSSTNFTSATPATIPIDSRIRGLMTVTPDLISGMMPPFKPEDYRSPKLYFLPNLDRVSFNYQEIEDTKRLARQALSPGTAGNGLVSKSPKPYTTSNDTMASLPPISIIGGSHQSGTSPHCPHCGSANLKLQNDNRYRCLGCKKRTVSNKIVWK